MRKNELGEIATFLEIVRKGGIARAAAELDVTTSAVSQALRKFEARLGVRLLNRTTRGTSPTDTGSKLADRLRSAFTDIQDAVETASSSGQAPIGTVRLTVSGVAAALLVMPHVAEFHGRHPGLVLQVSVADRLVDLIGDQFDAGIRRGDLLPSSMVQRRLTKGTRMIAVAAPSYLEGRPPPMEPEDLRMHDCIRVRSEPDGAVPPWVFAKGQARQHIKVPGHFSVDSTPFALEAALGGAGIAYLAEDYLRIHIRAGRLTRVLPEWDASRPGFFIYYPGQRHVLAGVTLLASFLREKAALGREDG